MNSRTQKTIGWVLAGIAGLLVIASGIAKLAGATAVVEGLTKAGVGPFIPYLGAMEIVFTALFLFPRTTKIGFLLLTSYFAGALATDLSHGNPMVTAFSILVIVWVSTFLRNPEIFVDTKTLAKV